MDVHIVYLVINTSIIVIIYIWITVHMKQAVRYELKGFQAEQKH